MKEETNDEIIYYKTNDSDKQSLRDSFRDIFDLTRKYANDGDGFKKLGSELKRHKIKATVFKTLKNIPIASIFTSLFEYYLK